MQEKRKGRECSDAQALRDAVGRGRLLLAALGRLDDPPNVSREAAALDRLGARVAGADGLDEAARLALYRELRWLVREIALRNPLFGFRRLVFMERRRFICQMLHEYLGYYYDYGDIAGGGVRILENPGRSFDTVDLVRGRLPRGNYTTLSLSFDGRTIYFAFAARATDKPDYYSAERRCFHIYAMDADGGNLRRLTDGPNDDFDPCELPDGGVAFMSTRRGGFGRCHNVWEPLPAYTLHRMNADGSGVRTLSFHETNEWHPSVLHDGSIVYTRWDYVDRSAAHFHGLWTANPDGTDPRVLFGSYTQRINACYQPRAIPGSNRVIFVAGAHHASVGGSLVIVDPSRVSLDPESGQDRFEATECLTPEVCYPEAPGWPKSWFHSPWPLSEDFFLVSFSFDPLPGMGPGEKRDTETGLYLFDRFGNMELLYREAGISCMYPIPLAPRSRPRVIPSTVDSGLGDEGEFILTDASRSLYGMPRGRSIRELRIFQILPKSETHVGNKPRIGYANAESARMLLGTVPVRPDGSAYFRAPARKPLYFQAVDGSGHAVQTMRSVMYLQPGERRGCVGCHEPMRSTPEGRLPLAMHREPDRIRPGPDGSRPWSYLRLVQPVLDARCVRCHDGTTGAGKSKPDLTRKPSGTFTASYESLRDHVRWYEWGGKTIHAVVTKPGEMPSDVSSLMAVLADANHRGVVKLTEDERRRIALWLDGNAAFYGTYSEPEQLAQSRGEAVAPPRLQ
ncbi:MAG: hypothetical protein JXQ73_14030 [Phycisphaerae bacterium]|nr:hypothetical protein [Phycisphaerae bacterium]